MPFRQRLLTNLATASMLLLLALTNVSAARFGREILTRLSKSQPLQLSGQPTLLVAR